MPRYVILEHDHPFLHWDLMLESGSALRTWRLLALPRSGQTIPAQASFDHRLAYLDYEGPVSGGRGWVKRWDWGTFQEETHGAPEGEGTRVTLQGKLLQGCAILEQLADGQWSFRMPSPPGSAAGQGRD
jgi:hypothetical protein